MTYKKVRAAFEGHFDPVLLEASSPHYVARDELLDRLQQLEGGPALNVKSDLGRETIILGNKIDGQKNAIPYDDIPKTDEYRENLKTMQSVPLNIELILK
ncbi:MAG: hypothetical protein P8M25_00275 [Paracoccaceae bacterium]|nr:hypothetical protein [Paracoccaceae bacterium]